MGSVEILIVMGVVCISAMGVVGWIATRHNQTLDHLARSAERFSERNDRARDRFYQTVIEKMQVQGNTDATVKLAMLHGQETTRQMGHNLQHDHAVESIDRVTEKRIHRKHKREEEVLAASAMMTPEDGM